MQPSIIAKEQPTSDNDELTKVLTQHRVEQFYFAEAAALDERRFDDWLDFFADNAHYWMPIRRSTMNKDAGNEFTKRGDVAFFDDTKELLQIRVNKLGSGFSWSEDPPSRTRRIISNVRVLKETRDELTVTANFVVHRARYEDEEDCWYGRRLDLLKLSGDSFKIQNREIYLEQTVILSRNLSVMF